MNEPITETQVGVAPQQPQVIESSLKRLWEKIRTAAEVIQSLRGENRVLGARIATLEHELESLRTEGSVREQEIKRLRAERAQLLQANTNTNFSEEEKEILKSRIRDLIAKINSHL